MCCANIIKLPFKNIGEILNVTVQESIIYFPDNRYLD